MKNLNLLLIAVLVGWFLPLSAQQDPYFSLYQFNRNVINPAYAGSGGQTEFLLGVRNQWVKLDDAPRAFNFNFNHRFDNQIGAGLTVVSDKVFVLSETHLYGDVSYGLPLSEDLTLYSGLKLGGSFLNIDLAGLVGTDPLFTENVDTFNPNVGFGLLLQSSDFYVSVSAPGILKNERYEKSGVTPSEAVDNLHFYGGAGYEFSVSDNVRLMPSFLARMVADIPVTIDATLAARFHEKLQFGVNYRVDESVTAFVTFDFLEQFSIGYGFEKATSGVVNFSESTHDFFFRIRLDGKEKDTMAMSAEPVE